MSPKPRCALVGERYNNLIVLGEAEKRNKKRYVRCLCDCGRETVVRVSSLRDGTTKGCGCGQGNPVHRMRHSTEYTSWRHIKDRCLNPNNAQYGAYGGRGITLCDAWKEDFLSFYAHIGPKSSPDLSVDRIDNNKGYEPGNVRWATHMQQVRNTRQNRLLTLAGRTQTLGAWADELGICNRTLETRLSRGWSVERALKTEVRRQKTKRKGLTALGKHQSLPQWEKETGIDFKTILARINKGWPADEAVTTPAEVGANQTLRGRK